MTKKHFALLIVVIILLSVLSGCRLTVATIPSSESNSSTTVSSALESNSKPGSDTLSELSSEGEASSNEKGASSLGQTAAEATSSQQPEKESTSIVVSSKPTTSQNQTKPSGSTSSAKPQKPVSSTPSKRLLRSESETSKKEAPYKYGLKKIITTTKHYLVYSDGSRTLDSTDTDEKIDNRGYNATDSQLLSESQSLAVANKATYQKILTLVNQIRADAGVSPLVLDDTLCVAATMRSVEMDYSSVFDHTRPNGSSCFSVFDTFPMAYYAAGENIAQGYGTAEAVVAGWRNSPGHYQNMITADFKKLGVGLSDQLGGKYWTQLFIG